MKFAKSNCFGSFPLYSSSLTIQWTEAKIETFFFTSFLSWLYLTLPSSFLKGKLLVVYQLPRQTDVIRHPQKNMWNELDTALNQSFEQKGSKQQLGGLNGPRFVNHEGADDNHESWQIRTSPHAVAICRRPPREQCTEATRCKIAGPSQQEMVTHLTVWLSL